MGFIQSTACASLSSSLLVFGRLHVVSVGFAIIAVALKRAFLKSHSFDSLFSRLSLGVFRVQINISLFVSKDVLILVKQRTDHVTKKNG